MRMLRIIQNTSAAGAKSYYSSADYYSEGQELVGVWKGKGAQRLGLSGTIDPKDWDALCDNRHPETHEKLTLRQKKPRRVGYDFNFHVPKSLSLLYGITRDERLLDAFRSSVDETMIDIESEMKTRVRTGGRNEDRTTGNMVCGQFIHFTARPVDGVPDPHLHAHCFVFNATMDPEEHRWKAGQFSGLKRDAPYFEAMFHSRLARRMEELGLPVLRTKTGWELEGFGKQVLDRFSRRTALIEDQAKQKGITDPKQRDGLGAKTRSRKAKDLSVDDLRRDWLSRLSPDEADGVMSSGHGIGREAIREEPGAAPEGVRQACEHWFERNAVVPERKLLARALKRSVGKSSTESVHKAFKAESLLTGDRDGVWLATTPEVLTEERKMLDFARKGRGTRRPLGSPDHTFRRDWLNEGQKRAVRHVLGSSDRVILIRGAAGVGKTTMMKEAVEAIEQNGKKVFTFAPSADASRGVLRDEGFADADTVARLLLDEQLQQEVRDQVIWIDEAGLLGTKTTGEVFKLADKLEARVVLSGDRRQHGSVERGSALRLLETEAGLIPSEIREIQRQSGEYKNAVRALSEGRIGDGFKELDRLGWIKEVGDEDRYRVMARDYVEAVTAMAPGDKALVVSPTHREGDRITAEIRSQLKIDGRLGKQERELSVLSNANLTEAERRDPINYAPGDVLVFHQNAKGYKKGERLVVRDKPLPLDQAARFQLFRRGSLAVAPGDVVRVTRNGMGADGKGRLNNGAIYSVKGFTSNGDMLTDSSVTIPKNYAHMSYGYVVTSNAAQGKSVSRVFIGQSSESFPASSPEQFYVSASRGKNQATIYTDDKSALLEAVSGSTERLSATELMASRIAEAERAAHTRADHQRAQSRQHKSGREEEMLVHE